MPAIPQPPQPPAQPDLSGRMTTDEFDFFNRHPGGFDRQFFVTNLPQNHATFLAVQNLPAEQVRVKVTFETGEEVDVISARPALTWVAFDTEDHETRMVPMAAVRQVRILRRPGEPAAVGFTVEPAEEEEDDAAQAIEEAPQG